MGTTVTIVEAPFVWPRWDERRRQLFLRRVKQETAVRGTPNCPVAFSRGVVYEHEAGRVCQWCGRQLLESKLGRIAP